VTDVAVAHAAAAFASCCGATHPVAAIVLGSGLGGLAAHIEHPTRLRFADLPGIPHPTTAGHSGELIHGMLCDREVIAIAGRLHVYEGLDPSVATIPIRIAAAMGARILVLSNAAGGIRSDLAPGSLMLLTDHLNLMWRRPSVRATPRYDAALGSQMHSAADAARVPLFDGVYGAMLGPSFETPAEIRMLERLGADAVGMSTVPETIVASALGLRVVAISCITNRASGISDGPLSHAETLEVSRQAAPRFERLVRAFIQRLKPSG
jgi:purine-nucleoside phosphorylase